MTPEAAFGQVLAHARTEKAISQEELAFESNLDRTFISRLENGKRQPTLSTILRISAALGIPAAELVSRVESTLEGF